MASEAKQQSLLLLPARTVILRTVKHECDSIFSLHLTHMMVKEMEKTSVGERVRFIISSRESGAGLLAGVALLSLSLIATVALLSSRISLPFFYCPFIIAAVLMIVVLLVDGCSIRVVVIMMRESILWIPYILSSLAMCSRVR